MPIEDYNTVHQCAECADAALGLAQPVKTLPHREPNSDSGDRNAKAAVEAVSHVRLPYWYVVANEAAYVSDFSIDNTIRLWLFANEQDYQAFLANCFASDVYDVLDQGRTRMASDDSFVVIVKRDYCANAIDIYADRYVEWEEESLVEVRGVVPNTSDLLEGYPSEIIDDANYTRTVYIPLHVEPPDAIRRLDHVF